MLSLKEFKEKFDPILKEFLEKRVNEFSENTNDLFVKDFMNYSKTLTLAGGKRVRPYIAYVMYVANEGRKIEEAIKIFVSLEVFHMFALIHDDIMDRQDKRHGVDTVHAYVLKKLYENKRSGDLENVAKSQAILAGDLFFSWAMEIFLDNKNFPKENLSKAHAYFYKMVDEVCMGQILDVDTTTREIADESLINEKTRLKTSRYTFVRPMQIGAHLANANNTLDKFSDELGTLLGIAFQMQDDLLDIVGDSKTLEKNILRDVSDRQHTFFTNYIFAKGTLEQKDKLNKFFGKELSGDEQKEIVRVFIDSGAIDEGKKIISQKLLIAKKIINASNLEKEFKTTCLNLVNLMEKRQN